MDRSELIARASPFIESARTQRIVIGAVMMREIHTRYGRENLGFVWLVAEPLIFCVGVMGLWSMVRGRYDHGVPLLAFVMTGYLPLTFWRHVVQRAVQCFRSNASLLYHRQVKMMDLLIARVLLEFYGAIIAFAVIGFVFMSLGLYEPPRDWFLFYIGWFYFLLFTMSIGLIVGSLTEIYEWSEKLIGPLMYLQLPLGGSFYMVDWLPERFQPYAELIPTVQAFEMIRGGQFGSSVQVHYDMAYETLVCFALLSIGMLMCRNVHRHLVIA